MTALLVRVRVYRVCNIRQTYCALTLSLFWEVWQEMVDFLVECWDQEGLYD